MKKVNELFDARIDIIMDNYSSVFTKDDIVSLLVSLRTDTLKAIVEEQPTTEYTADKIVSTIKDLLNEVPFLDYVGSEPELHGSYGDSYSLEMNTTFDEDEFIRHFVTDVENYFVTNND
jgi:hypothetical protein